MNCRGFESKLSPVPVVKFKGEKITLKIDTLENRIDGGSELVPVCRNTVYKVIKI